MTEKKLKIHSENILPIIKKWLYSSKDIFLRELVSNACDALSKYRILNPEATDLGIHITTDAENRLLTISDNGIGMTAEEVDKYIAQIAFSGAEEFLEKYKDHDEKHQVIGHFGLGFYSAYMVASDVTIETLSYQEGAESARWECDGSSTYQLTQGSRSQRGTDIILSVAPGEDEALDPTHLREILRRYCLFLPFPITLNGALINEKEPLWLKPASECSDTDYLEFYRQLFPHQVDPLFWIHLNVDYPFHLQGILYFPRMEQDRDWKRENIKLYCNRVFVSDNCQDLLPDYLTMLQGAMDSPNIPLNVSRSYLQVDKTVRQVGQHIAKKVSDRLNQLYTEDRAKYLELWEQLEPIVKLGSLQDEKFYERTKPCLLWQTRKGDWLSVDEIVAGESEKTIYYAPKEMSSHPIASLLTDKGKTVVLTRNSPLDLAVMHFMEEKAGVHFQRVDAKIEDHFLDPSKEKTVLDAEGKTEGSKIALFFQHALQLDSKHVEAKSLASDQVPALLMLQEHQRRMRDQLAFHRQGMNFPIEPTLVVNTNHPLIQATYHLKEEKPELANALAKQIYELARLSQREMNAEQMGQFIAGNTDLLAKLAVAHVKAESS